MSLNDGNLISRGGAGGAWEWSGVYEPGESTLHKIDLRHRGGCPLTRRVILESRSTTLAGLLLELEPTIGFDSGAAARARTRGIIASLDRDLGWEIEVRWREP